MYLLIETHHEGNQIMMRYVDTFERMSSAVKAAKTLRNKAIESWKEVNSMLRNDDFVRGFKCAEDSSRCMIWLDVRYCYDRTEYVDNTTWTVLNTDSNLQIYRYISD